MKQPHRQILDFGSLTRRQQLPQQIAAFLPLTLFFQVGLMYAGLALFLLSFAASGQWQLKWQRIRQSPLLWPVLALSALSMLMSAIHPRPAGEFASALLHYQSYWILFPLLIIGGGAWQRAAIRNFFIGAVLASTLFYLNSAGALPDMKLFKSYTLYEGNKSILLGLLLAISAAWMLHEWRIFRDWHGARALVFVYVLLALLLCAKSRTASLLFLILLLVLTGIWASASARFWRWYVASLAALLVTGSVLLTYVVQLPPPATCLAKEMHDRGMNGLQILAQRGICTVHQVRDFGKNGQVTEDGMRLEIYRITWSMVEKSPLIGHGIGNWLPLYRDKAQGMISEKMTTPHNDYLLYWFELGIGGVLCLLAIWLMQFKVAVQMHRHGRRVHAAPLAMLTVAMMFAACFNAIMRDGVFAFAMLILLAIPLASLNLELSWREKNKTND